MYGVGGWPEPKPGVARRARPTRRRIFHRKGVKKTPNRSTDCEKETRETTARRREKRRRALLKVAATRRRENERLIDVGDGRAERGGFYNGVNELRNPFEDESAKSESLEVRNT